MPLENRSTHPNMSTNNRGFHSGQSFTRQQNTGGENRQKGKTPLHCTYCNLDKNTIDVCYKLHEYPTKRPRNSSKKSNSGSSSSGLKPSKDRALVSALLITQEQYNNTLALLSSVVPASMLIWKV
ncbi:unnamed protein product [Ilex paraguariensis]|uniref:Uncharacterized protein n=1 Tax=Ilex paraguariensis TaxID=185542 RepID=A0ABC8TU28_9AQUA